MPLFGSKHDKHDATPATLPPRAYGEPEVGVGGHHHNTATGAAVDPLAHSGHGATHSGGHGATHAGQPNVLHSNHGNHTTGQYDQTGGVGHSGLGHNGQTDHTGLGHGAQTGHGLGHETGHAGAIDHSQSHHNNGLGTSGVGNQSHGLPPTGHINPTPHGTSTGHHGSGKLEKTVGSLVGSRTLKEKGLEKEREAEAFKIQSAEIGEAERLESEARVRRERAVAHGAHPANGTLGGGGTTL